MRRFLLILSLLFFTIVADAQKLSLDSVSERHLLLVAKKYRLGVNSNVDVKKAISLYRYLIVNKKSSLAMYELGRIYFYGDEIKRDYIKAYSLFSQAAKMGVSQAYCKMAFMNQKGLGRPMNLKDAFYLYRHAAKLGVAQGFYGAGYLLYKGLGVKQNLSGAVEYLKKGSELKHSGCSFLLGVYYANKEDTEFNQCEAIKYFEKALKFGHGWTSDVTKLGVYSTLKEHIQSVKNKLSELGIQENAIIDKTSEISNVNDFSQLTGKWEGHSFILKWGESAISKVQKVKLSFEDMNGNANMVKWFEGDSLITNFTPELSGNNWKEYKITKDKMNDSFVITSAKFELSNNLLLGLVYRINPREREYLKPAFVMLRKVNKGIAEQGNFKFKSVSVVGNTLEFQVDSEKMQDIYVKAVSPTGMLVKESSKISLNKGENKFQIDINLLRGLYVVTVSNGKSSQSKVVLHK